MRTLLALLLATSPAFAQLVDGLSATCTGIEVVPPTSSSLFVPASAVLDWDSGTATFSIDAPSGPGVTVELFVGGEGEVGPPLDIPLLTQGGGWFSLPEPLDAATFDALLHERVFVQVATSAFPGGEVRGQIRARRHHQGLLEGEKVVPPSGSAASGIARVELLQPSGQLAYSIDVVGMQATGAELRAGFNENGPLVAELPGSGTSLAGTTAPLTNDQLVQLLTRDLYVVVKSAAFPAGEVRDQLWEGGINQDVFRFGAQNGTSIFIDLRAGLGFGDHFALMVGSASGTAPTFPLGALDVPLVPDAYTSYLLANPGAPPTLSNLSVTGQPAGVSNRTFSMPPGFAAPIVGQTLHHAFLLFDLFELTPAYVSNPLPITVE